MRVHVKFFALFREMIGVKEEWTEIPEGATVGQLWEQYASRSPRAAKLRTAYAVNQKLVKPDQVLKDGDEVGFLPPVSGGEQVKRRKAKGATEKAKGKSRNRIRNTQYATREKQNAKRRAPNPRGTLSPGDAVITRRPLDLGAMVRRVEYSGAGAIVTFSGVVRDNAQGKAVDHLEYEAYPEMAQATLSEIMAEIKARWSDVRVAMAHRVGRLKIGQASLIIAVAAPHRPEAYAASRYAIERVKAVLPVWKKEFANDGDYWVEGPVAGEVPPEKAEAIARTS